MIGAELIMLGRAPQLQELPPPNGNHWADAVPVNASTANVPQTDLEQNNERTMGIFLPGRSGREPTKRDVYGRGERHVQPMAGRPSVERGGFLEESEKWVKTAARVADAPSEESADFRETHDQKPFLPQDF
jgi:hypothetical protein